MQQEKELIHHIDEKKDVIVQSLRRGFSVEIHLSETGIKVYEVRKKVLR